MKKSNNLSKAALVRIRSVFGDMIHDPNTKEADFQKFFSDYPFVISNALPIKIQPDQIIPAGRPGKSEADFIFHPTAQGTYGVIEIKTPKQPIVTVPRKGILNLSRDASTALRQAEEYLKQLKNSEIIKKSQMLAIGSKAHAFIIIGLSSDLTKKVTSEVLRSQLEGLYPAGFGHLTFDDVYKRMLDPEANRLHVIRLDVSSFAPRVWQVDYRNRGLVTGPGDIPDKLTAQVSFREDGYPYILKPGTCLYCGGFDCKPSFGAKHTPAGPFLPFFSSIDEPNGVRKVSCGQHSDECGSSLEFDEIYDFDAFQLWSKTLSESFCERCLSTNIKGGDWGDEVASGSDFECLDCGLYHSTRSWGPLSRGA